MPDLRIGFIGAGNICRTRHVPGLNAVEGVKLIAVSNRTPESSARAAAEFHIPEIEPDWRALAGRADLDAVFIGTWPYTHREMATAVLESGKHCFCQARMAMDLDEAKAMAEVARAHPNQVAMICPPPMRMPFEPYLKKVLDSGELGEITLVELTSTGGENLRPGVTWREKIELSGRQVLAMGIFAETLNALFGPYESLSAFSAIPVPVKEESAGHPYRIQIPQVVTITGRLRGGSLAIERHSGLAADSETTGSVLTIWGLRGTLRYRFDDTIWRAGPGGKFTPVEVPEDLRRGWRVERDFVEAVRAAQAGMPWTVSPDFEEGLLYMQKVEAVHLAAATGRTVRPGDL